MNWIKSQGSTKERYIWFNPSNIIYIEIDAQIMELIIFLTNNEEIKLKFTQEDEFTKAINSIEIAFSKPNAKTY